MTKKEISEVLKYSSSFEIFVLTQKNKIKLLKCLFKVLVISSTSGLKSGQILLVSEVKVTSKLKMVFIIYGRAFYYYYFEILV